MLTKLSHQGIVPMKVAWADKKFYYLLFEYAVHGDLLTFVKKNCKCIFPSHICSHFNA